MPKIEIKISRTGEVEYEVSGVKGAGCKDLTKAIDELSTGVVETQDKPEIHETETRHEYN